MKFNSRIGKNDGFTLIETMIVVGILAIISYSMTSMLVNSGKELRKLTIRHEKLEHRAYLMKAMSDASICTCNLRSSITPFDGSTATEVDVSTLRIDCDSTSTIIAQPNTDIPASSTKLRVNEIEIKELAELTPNRYQGKFQVSYEMPDGTDAGRPWEAVIKFRTDPSSPMTAKVFDVCESVSFSDGGGGGGSLSVVCPKGQFLTGIAAGSPLCSSIITPGQPPANDPAEGYSPTSPGPGCIGSYCLTVDYGPCDGAYCVTNGNRCDGSYCVACSATGSCTGAYCCTGPSCGRCNKIGL